MTKLSELSRYGQSFWLGNLGRSLITSGRLARLIREDDLRGVTSNPAIFEKSIAGSRDYAEALRALAPHARDAKDLYERLAIEDVQAAADVLRPVYEETAGRDGFVSLEVSPALAHDLQGTVAEGRRLWKQVDRPNLMIKVPATPAGIPAIEQLIADGLNVNVTLLFSVDVYEEVVNAYTAGLEARARKGQDNRRVSSVASFFVSRVDTAVDELLEARLAAASPAEAEGLRRLVGKAAIANARLAYERCQRLVAQPRWKALESGGARSQRVLWASTGTKNPAYRDVVYIEELVGRDTVNTMPPATADAFRDHGRAGDGLEGRSEEARAVMRALGDAGISMRDVTGRLLDDGLRLFAEAFERLLAAVDRARLAAP
jgi:transaldolase/glucose-6-phosphate isomerase